MSKRGADKELTDRNWDDEEEPEDVRMSLSNSVLMKCYESTSSPSFWDLISSEIDCHSLRRRVERLRRSVYPPSPKLCNCA